MYDIISVMTHNLICYVLFFCAIFVVTTCDLIFDRSTKQYPLNVKNRLHILNNREAYYYYYYYYYYEPLAYEHYLPFPKLLCQGYCYISNRILRGGHNGFLGIFYSNPPHMCKFSCVNIGFLVACI